MMVKIIVIGDLCLVHQITVHQLKKHGEFLEDLLKKFGTEESNSEKSSSLIKILHT